MTSSAGSTWTMSCVVCRRNHGVPVQPRMGQLSECRVVPHQKPFFNVGIDAFGPYDTKSGVARPVHIMLFTCLASRAIHLELVRSQDLSEFVDAFRRFVARRGQVKAVYSDNTATFVGGNRAMNSAFGEHLAGQRIEWPFAYGRSLGKGD